MTQRCVKEVQACVAGRNNYVASKAAVESTALCSRRMHTSSVLKEMCTDTLCSFEVCWCELMYLCKNCWVKKQTATVGLQHGHVLLYRWEPFAAKSCKEVLHL